MNKTFSIFINFDGNCSTAVRFYAEVFRSEVLDMMTYAQMPPDPAYPVAKVDKDRVAYCSVPIFGNHVMFSDFPSNMPLTKGDNISPTLGSDDADEIRRVFTALSEGGEVLMPLEKTFWSKLYGSVRDKYGVIWQLSHDEAEDVSK